eukprot:3067491-Alexandrium_andersonii.AAC.1
MGRKFLQGRSKSGSESFRTVIVRSSSMPASAFRRSSAAAPEPPADGSAGAAAAPAFASRAALRA